MADNIFTPPARNFKDITGCVFGRLTALRRIGRNKERKATWLCRCICGTEIIVTGKCLRNGNTQSCGCLCGRSKYGGEGRGRLRHGHAANGQQSATLNSWSQMKQRCLNPKSIGYQNYGGRGITVCDRWKNSFENFLADMGKRPKGYELERIDNNSNYEPNNCRWATHREQSINRRTNHLITFENKTLCVTDWANRYNLSPSIIFGRLNRGWHPKDAIFTPPQKRTKRKPNPKNELSEQ